MEPEISLPPKLAENLLEITREPKPSSALITLMFEFIDLKLESIEEKIKNFEKKWGMSFKKFKKACKENKLKEDSYSYKIEKDYKEWESLITLKKYYKGLRDKCLI